jgi:hypothetical protein
MKTHTDYTELADKLDGAKVEKRLEQLRTQEPPKKRKSAADVLAPYRDRLADLHANGWTYAQLAEELKNAGLPVAVGTLRDYLGNGGHGRKSKGSRRGGKRGSAVGSAGR